MPTGVPTLPEANRLPKSENTAGTPKGTTPEPSSGTHPHAGLRVTAIDGGGVPRWVIDRLADSFTGLAATVYLLDVEAEDRPIPAREVAAEIGRNVSSVNRVRPLLDAVFSRWREPGESGPGGGVYAHPLRELPHQVAWVALLLISRRLAARHGLPALTVRDRAAAILWAVSARYDRSHRDRRLGRQRSGHRNRQQRHGHLHGHHQQRTGRRVRRVGHGHGAGRLGLHGRCCCVGVGRRV